MQFFQGNRIRNQIQIWVTLIANLLLILMKRQLKRSWSFSGLATLVRIVLMYYVDSYSLFEPESDCETIFEPKEAPPEPNLFGWGAY